MYAADTCTYHRLAGYSGADVLLATTPAGERFVRKQASTPEQNSRLQKQIELQRAFASLRGRPFHVPAILGDGLSGDTAFVDMEYVDGISAPVFLAAQPQSAIRRFRDALVEALTYLAARPPLFEPALPPFEGLCARVLQIAQLDREFSDRFALRILKALEDWRSGGDLPPTLCHGDFTLENILVTRDHELVLLDYLDGPWSHVWQDISKLHVDLDGHWYARRFPRISEWTLRFLKEGLNPLTTSHDGEYCRYHALLVALNLTRILPYSTSAPDHRLLLDQIGRQLNLLELAE